MVSKLVIAKPYGKAKHAVAFLPAAIQVGGMCGRFTITADGEIIVSEFGLPDVPFDYRPRYNVAPMQDVLAIIKDGEKPRAGWVRWGLVPNWAPDPSVGTRMINARSETVGERSAFSDAFEHRRCLIIADGFYEWQRIGKIKVPMRIHLRDDRPFAFAGLWERWSRPGAPPLVSGTILTTTPSPSIAGIHDRMPVMLGPRERELWLDRDADAAALRAVLQPYPDEQLEAYVVSQLVNHVDNDSPACVAPAEPPSQAAAQTTLF
jgi:putative SOS response-associated peptidase YedK